MNLIDESDNRPPDNTEKPSFNWRRSASPLTITLIIVCAVIIFSGAWIITNERSESGSGANKSLAASPTPRPDQASKTASTPPNLGGQALGDGSFDPYGGSAPFPSVTADAYTKGLAQAWNLNFLTSPDKRQPNQKMAAGTVESDAQGYHITVTGDPENQLRFVECRIDTVHVDRASERLVAFLRDCVTRAIADPEGTKAIAWLDAKLADPTLDLLNLGATRSQLNLNEQFGWAHLGLVAVSHGIIVRIGCS